MAVHFFSDFALEKSTAVRLKTFFFHLHVSMSKAQSHS